MKSLDRFKSAQDQAGPGYASALRELQAGRKQSHWIWYIFPQLSGLGRSSVSQAFGVDGWTEALDYLRDPVLRARLLAASNAVAQHLSGERALLLTVLMGSTIDARKLVSSLTLFRLAAISLVESDGVEECGSLATTADQILSVAAAQGWRPCQRTLRRLAGEPPR